ncbi:MAG: SusC/RagA family TonB-linked outer membrane protein [Mangrovibacterium sp.]
MCCALLGSAYAQQSVSGKVVDSKGQSMPGVTILLKGTTNGVITNVDGKYQVGNVATDGVLVFTFVGMKTQEVAVNGRSEINVTMREETTGLDEVVVVGYGTMKKSDLTGGISTIPSEQIAKIPAVSLGQRIQGQIAGLNVTSSNNKPGEDATFRVRGEKSLSGGNNPLIILDGIPFNGSITEIDQNSVDNISVLRDASSAAIYGSRAANGVILITTKKGKEGKATVRYNGYVGVQQAEWLPDLMNGEEYIQLLKDYRKDTDDPEWDNPSAWLQLSLIDNYKNGKETDWNKEVFRTALQQEHQVSISGATDATNYFVSLSYSDQDGIVEYTGYKKYAITSNISQQLSDWLNIGLNLQLLERDRSGNTPAYSYAFRMSPYGDVRDENGRYVRYPMSPETMYYSPFADQDAIVDDISRGAYTSTYADIKLPIEGLSYRANFGYSYRHREQGSYYGSTTMSGDPVGGSASISNTSYGDWTWENIVRYERDFGKHHLDLTGLYSAQKTFTSEHESSGEKFLSDANSYHNIDMAQGTKTIASSKSETSLLSWMGRANYSYDRRYLLTLTARRDGYSAFGDNNKWALFPSVAGAWVMSEESFFKDWGVRHLDFLKFRLSYGSNGNQAVSAYQTKTKLVQKDYIFGNDAEFAGGLVANFSKGNPNLKWETSYSFNAGIDFNLFANRLNGQFDYYITNTKDLLMSRTVPVMNGYTSMMDNVGQTQNKGFDLSLNSVNIKKSDFQWNTTLVLSGNWSEIIALKEDGKDDVSNKWFIGEPVKVYYDYKAVGIWQESERIEAEKFGAIPGDAKLLDKDKSGTITTDDRVIIGSRIPTWTAGLTNTLTYKNWSFSLFLNGVFDVTKDNGTIQMERQLFGKNVNYINGINYWTPENPSNEVTRLGYAETKHTFYTDGSFLRIQDVNLSYQFPKELTSRIGIEGLTTYVNARNLYTFSKAKKYTTNLEQDKYTLDASGYPTPRVLIVGVNLTF